LRSRRGAEQVGDDVGGQLRCPHLEHDPGGADGEREPQERATVLLGADQAAEITEVDIRSEIDPRCTS
jgi:hypothetical protein